MERIMPRLVAIDGPETGLSLPIAGPETILGARAAVVRRQPETGAYRVERLAPDGAELRVNGEVVEAATLSHGDTITLGLSTLMFEAEPEGVGSRAAAAAPAVSGAATAAAAATSAAVDATMSGTFGAVPPTPPLPMPRYGGGAQRPPRSARGPSTPPVTGDEPRRPTPEPIFEDAIPTSSPSAKDLAGESIRYRQKAYEDPTSVLKTLPAVDAVTRRLSTLLKVLSAISATLDLPFLLRTLLDLVFAEVPADRGTILLFDREKRHRLLKMASRARRGEVEVPVSRTIIKEALRTRESILTVDALTDARFQLRESIHAAGIRSAMCLPLVLRDRILGVIHLDTSDPARQFGREDLDLCSAIASMAALAIENARLYQEAAERERLRYELTLASAIQARLLPKEHPLTPDLDVCGRTTPAKELGGDYFDYIEGADGSLSIIAGDVSGKGVGAGLIMAMARSYFRPLVRAYTSPRRVLAEANRLLYNDTNREIFMSAVLLRWEPPAKRFLVTGAGQEHLILYRAADRQSVATPAGGIALALIEDAEEHLEEKPLVLAPGDALVLYSDGVTEARAADGKFFGLERLTLLVDRLGGLATAREILEGIERDVQQFQGQAEQHDDITVVVIKRRPAP
jgi:serine phosphatase RsbU (regulator of sigma subunit)